MSEENKPPGDKTGQQAWADGINQIISMQLETQKRIAREMTDHREQMLKAYKSASSISGFREYGELAIIMHICSGNKEIRRKCLEFCQPPAGTGTPAGPGESGGGSNGSAK